MQIGSTELLIILILVIAAYGFYKARHAASARPPAARPDPQAGSNPFGENTGADDPATNTRASNPASAKDPYVVLNIPRNAPKEEVVAAYKKLAQMYHPDKVAGLAPEYHLIAEKKMREINAAYEQIMNRSGR
jgi:DnaJ-domain-containing protein 1